MDNKEFLGKEPVGKLLWKLALPTVAAQIINMLYNIVDRIYIGHIPKVGTLALTGVGVVYAVVILIVSAFAALVSNGGAPRATIFMGQNKKEKAEKTLGNCFITQIFVSVVLTAVLLIWNREFEGFRSQQRYNSVRCRLYEYLCVGNYFCSVDAGDECLYYCAGVCENRYAFCTDRCGCQYHSGPDLYFWIRYGGTGRLRLPLFLSQTLSCIWVLSFLFGRKTNLKIRFQYMKLESKIIFPSLALGLSVFIMQASESIISVCFNSSLQQYGGDIAVGAMTILTSVMQFAMLPLQGLGQGAQPIISYNYGAKNVQRVKDAYGLLLKASLCYATFLWLLVMIVPQGFAAMFTTDPALLDFTKTALRIYLAALFLFGIQLACQMTFNSLGNAKASILVAVMRKFILLIPLIYIVPAIWKSNRTLAVYMAEPIADVIAVTFTAILFFFQFRKALKQIEGNNPAK